MNPVLFAFLLGAVMGGMVSWRWGWNAAVRLYRDRTVDAANERERQDRV
jgi:hypothetical protein